jgi:hypothetical protein
MVISYYIRWQKFSAQMFYPHLLRRYNLATVRLQTMRRFASLMKVRNIQVAGWLGISLLLLACSSATSIPQSPPMSAPNMSTPIVTSEATIEIAPNRPSTPSAAFTPTPPALTEQLYPDRPVSPTDATSNPLAYDGRTISLSGQTYVSSTSGLTTLVVDGNSGVNLTGNTSGLRPGFYQLNGVYHADSNTLQVAQFTETGVEYAAVVAGQERFTNVTPVVVEGL